MLYAYRSLARLKMRLLGSITLIIVTLLVNFNRPAIADSSWSVISTLPEPLFGMDVASVGSNLYVLGGTTHTDCSNIGRQTVEHTTVNEDGSLGEWTATSPLLSARSHQAVVTAGNRLYALGGVNECMLSDTTNTVEWAPVNTDGAIGSWQSTTSMNVRRYEHGAVTVNNYIYAIGGGDEGPVQTNTVERAVIKPDGSLDAWQLTSSLLVPRSYLAVATWDKYIYALGGGNNTNGLLNSVERVEVQPDGSLGDWEFVTPMTSPRTTLEAVALEGYLYAFGGQSNDGFLSSVERAVIHADGSLGSWQVVSAMTISRSEFAATVANGRIYAFGGFSHREQGTAILLDSVEVWNPADLPSTNQSPTANAGGPYLVAVGNSISLDGSASSDPDGDALSYQWAATGGTVNGSTFVAGNQAGVFAVTLTVSDPDGLSDTDTAMLVIYDPSGGFVTGSGSIWFQAGWCQLDPNICANAVGDANFGFVSKYKKGAQVPSGDTQFKFEAGNLNFSSNVQEWLVVNQSSSNAQFKGSGTINGQNHPSGVPYKFMIWAGDGALDTFRIRIWWEGAQGAEHIVYDNGTNQLLGRGNIVIHKAAKSASLGGEATEGHRLFVPLIGN